MTTTHWPCFVMLIKCQIVFNKFNGKKWSNQSVSRSHLVFPTRPILPASLQLGPLPSMFNLTIGAILNILSKLIVIHKFCHLCYNGIVILSLAHTLLCSRRFDHRNTCTNVNCNFRCMRSNHRHLHGKL